MITATIHDALPKPRAQAGLFIRRNVDVEPVMNANQKE